MVSAPAKGANRDGEVDETMKVLTWTVALREICAGLGARSG
jgi:hypothetical protein